MIEQAGIANLTNNLQSKVTKTTSQAAATANFLENFKQFGSKVAVLDNNTAAELNFSKWKFEDMWEDPDDKLFENPYDEIARIFRKFQKKK